MNGSISRRSFTALLFGAAAAPLAVGRAFAMAFSEYQADSFLKLLASGNSVVVHVHAEWCAVCKAQLPVMTKILAQPAYKNVRAVRVNFDKEQAFLADYRVPRQSTIIVFKGGKEIARMSYDADPKRIEQVLERAVA